VDSSGYVAVLNGSTWTASQKDVYGFNAVSCATSTYCVAVDNEGQAHTYNGSSWSTATADSLTALQAVSCPTTSFCAAVDGGGNVVRYNGSTWTKDSGADGSRALTGISCTSSSFCVAVDSAGYADFYNGSGWSATNVDSATALNGVSCVSASLCVAVDASGDALTYNGTWSSKSIDSSTSLAGVTCASASFCMAVDAAGNALNETPTPVLSNQLTWSPNASLPLVLSDGTNDYIYGPSQEPVEQVNVTTSPPANNPLFLTYTPTNSTWLVTNTSGGEVGYYGYDGFGTLAFGTPDSPFGYAGQYADASAGLLNMRARWYQPQTGSFTSVDPALSSTDQAYTYANDDPVNRTDPSGQWTHGYCLSETVGAFYGAMGGPTYNVSQSAMGCLEEDGHNNVAWVTSSSFVNGTDTSVTDLVRDFLNSGIASAGLAFDVLNTNGNTVFGGLRGGWEGATGGTSLFGWVGISGEVLWNPATNGSGYLFSGGVGKGLGLPISFSHGGLGLNSDPINSTTLQNGAKEVISTIDTFGFPGVYDLGEGGVPGWILNVFGLGGIPMFLGQIPPPPVHTTGDVTGLGTCNFVGA
jgi:RHS repeat-associated protein